MTFQVLLIMAIKHMLDAGVKTPTRFLVNDSNGLFAALVNHLTVQPLTWCEVAEGCGELWFVGVMKYYVTSP